MRELSSKMEFPEERYYRLNRIFLSALGLWPYDNFKDRKLRFALSLLILISFTSTQLIKLFISEYNLDLLLRVLRLDIFFITLSLKYVTFYAVTENIKEFRRCIWNSWDILADNREIEIILKQASMGRMYTKILTILIYFAVFLCFSAQYLPLLLDIVMPLNESRARHYAIEAVYFIDEHKYFHIIAIYVGIGLFAVSTTGIATETFALSNALYAFGLFKIASYRMKHILNENDAQIYTTKEYIISHGRIIAAVDMHRKAMQFSESIKTSFGYMYLILFIAVVISASINLFYLFRLITGKVNEKNTLEVFKTASFLILHLIYLFAANYAGQEFMNCDTHVYRMICNTKWYNASLKTQKLILFLIQKTTKCYQVDAAGMFNPSLEGLATALSMTLSYFMILCSV